MDAQELHLEFPVDPQAVGVARDVVEGALSRAAVPPPVLEDAQLLVSELLTNSIRHAGLDSDEHVELRAVASAQRVRVEVRDPGRGFHAPDRPEPRGTGGWGLWLVDRLADRWGVQHQGHTTVWFEIDGGRGAPGLA